MVPWSYQLAPQKLEQDSPRLPYSFTAIFPLCLLFVIFLLFHQPLTQTIPYYTVSQDDFFPHSPFTSPPNRKQNSLIELSQTIAPTLNLTDMSPRHDPREQHLMAFLSAHAREIFLLMVHISI